jgi:hypothetical protein
MTNEQREALAESRQALRTAMIASLFGLAVGIALICTGSVLYGLSVGLPGAIGFPVAAWTRRALRAPG